MLYIVDMIDINMNGLHICDVFEYEQYFDVTLSILNYTLSKLIIQQVTLYSPPRRSHIGLGRDF